MFIETIKTPGVAHLSYVIGNSGQACVIDPRRDIDTYLEIASNNECQIKCIFETHRNEDLISGSALLAQKTNAAVYHGPHAEGDVEYARTTAEGDCYSIGQLQIKVLETPGHTKDSVSYLLYDEKFPQGPAAIFTGDALFIGDVGRTDFYPDEAEKVAGMLFDSLQKIKREAHSAQLYPAHGAGSVCGDGMAEREFSTVAHEFENNPRLQMSREEFIEFKVNEFHYQPPYFSLMEKLNLAGAEAPTDPGTVEHLDMSAFAELDKDIVKIDIRCVDAFRGAYVEGSICLPTEMISAYAGWFFKSEQKFVLIAESYQQAQEAILELSRIGYDHCEGFATFNMPGWAAAGRDFKYFASVDTDAVERRVKNDTNDWCLLDVRKKNEVSEGRIKGAKHIYLGELIDELDQLDKNQHYTVMCGSGVRATVGASILSKHGFANVDIYLGSMSAWKNTGNELES